MYDVHLLGLHIKVMTLLKNSVGLKPHSSGSANACGPHATSLESLPGHKISTTLEDHCRR